MNIRNLITSVLLTTGLFAQAIVGVVTDVNSNPGWSQCSCRGN